MSPGASKAPASGWVSNGAHHLPVRVYFEDTDLAGVVYYANYLRFLERGRSDLLRLLQIDQRATYEAGQGVYAVADLQIRYLLPARLDDALLVETRCLAVGGASVRMRQRVLRGRDILVDSNVRVGFLAPDGRPCRQPDAWMEKFRALMSLDS